VRSPTSSLKTYRGTFESVKLAFKAEPPLSEEELSPTSADYPTHLAYLHLYLDGQDATELLPSAYMLWLLGDLLRGLADLTTYQSRTATAQWWSDPWRFELRGDPAHNRLYVTLHVPGRWVAMEDVSVPLDVFAREVILLAQEWRGYLETLFHEELTHPEWSGQIRKYDSWLQRAQEALEQYEKS
jgi:hypothetical protein